MIPWCRGSKVDSWLDVPASAGPHTFSSEPRACIAMAPGRRRSLLHRPAKRASTAVQAPQSSPYACFQRWLTFAACSRARLFRSRNQTKWVAVPALQLRPTATAMCPCMTSRPALRRLRLPRTPASASPPTLACTAPASSRAPRRPSTSPSRSSRRTRLRPVTGRRTRTRRTRWPPPCSSGPRTTVSTPPARARTRNRAALVVGYNFG